MNGKKRKRQKWWKQRPEITSMAPQWLLIPVGKTVNWE